MSDVVRVVIADDHPVVRSGIRGMLASDPGFDVVGEAADGAEAVALTTRELPDVVLMDLRMPALDGASATAEIRARCPETQVLVLTTYDTDADIVRALEAGAIGYLLKDVPHEEITRAVRAAARGEPALAPAVAERLMDRALDATGDALTVREIDVLQLAARGLSNSEIAKELFVSATTVKAHLSHIYRKLNVADRTAAVTTALERQIIRLDDADGGDAERGGEIPRLSRCHLERNADRRQEDRGQDEVGQAPDHVVGDLHRHQRQRHDERDAEGDANSGAIDGLADLHRFLQGRGMGGRLRVPPAPRGVGGEAA